MASLLRRPRAAGEPPGIVLPVLAATQFLMILDSSVMNVSIATVAKDVGTTVTGIQGAITAYTLVMASLMITGGKVGEIVGRKRAFTIGCVVYACGSLTTALSPNLTVLPESRFAVIGLKLQHFLVCLRGVRKTPDLPQFFPVKKPRPRVRS